MSDPDIHERLAIIETKMDGLEEDIDKIIDELKHMKEQMSEMEKKMVSYDEFVKRREDYSRKMMMIEVAFFSSVFAFLFSLLIRLIFHD